MDYGLAPQTIEEVLKLIARAPVGRQTLEAFLPLYSRGTVRFRPYPAEILAKLRAVLDAGQPIGACFENDGVSGTIHYDPFSPLGLLAPFVFHEIVHALEKPLWSDEARTQDKAAEITLNAEMRAFEKQHQLTQELSERLPEFAAFMREYLPKAKVLHEKLNEMEIAQLYGLRRAS